MKKFLWLMAFVSLFALGQVMAPISQAQIFDDNHTRILPDDNLTRPVLILRGQTASITVPLGALATGVVGEVPAFNNGNAQIATAINAQVAGGATSVDIGAIIASLRLPAGVYSVIVGGQKYTIFYIPYVDQLISR